MINEEVSFSSLVKEELTKNELNRDESISLLSSFLKNSGYLIIRDGKERIQIKTENAKVAKYIYKLIKEVFKDIEVSFTFRKSMKLKKSVQYLVNIDSTTDEVFSTLNLEFLSTKIDSSLTNKENKLKAYFVGLFLSNGSCSNPISSNYHFEFSTHDKDYANNIIKLTSKIKVYPFTFKVIQRRNSYVIYLKKSEQIASFLAFMDANESSLDYEGYRLDRDVINNTNRQANLDMYNYKKTLKNNEEINAIIQKIEKRIGVKNIANDKVRELCFLRLEFPEASYSELSDLLSARLGKKVSKSNIAHLTKSIKEIEEKYRIE